MELELDHMQWDFGAEHPVLDSMPCTPRCLWTGMSTMRTGTSVLVVMQQPMHFEKNNKL